MGQTVECSMSCSNLDRLWNQAMSTCMKYMLRMGFLAVTFWCEEVHRNHKHRASKRTLICHATMLRNTIDFGYNSGHVGLWCLEVVPVCKGLHQQSEWYLQKFIKWCNSHAQLTMWCCRCDESKQDEVAFQLAGADLGSNYLWHTSYLKYNSWMYITNMYHKMRGLKHGQRCVEVSKNGVIYSKWRAIGLKDLIMFESWPWQIDG